MPTGPASTHQADGTASAGSSGSIGQTTTAAMDLLAQVSEFLEDFGGELENDQVLKLLIALLILIALLQNDQSRSRSADDAMEALMRSIRNTAGATTTVSSTSIEIYQSTTLISINSTIQPDAFGQGEPTSGSNLDLLA